MTKKKTKKKLSLKPARLRRLDDGPLSEAVGGGGHGGPDPIDDLTRTCNTSIRAQTGYNHNQALAR